MSTHFEVLIVSLNPRFKHPIDNGRTDNGRYVGNIVIDPLKDFRGNIDSEADQLGLNRALACMCHAAMCIGCNFYRGRGAANAFAWEEPVCEGLVVEVPYHLPNGNILHRHISATLERGIVHAEIEKNDQRPTFSYAFQLDHTIYDRLAAEAPCMKAKANNSK